MERQASQAPEGVFRSSLMAVEPDWIDYNGHLNMAYYHVLFDRGVDAFYDSLGLGIRYAQSSGFTTYAAEVHVCYVRELHENTKTYVTTQIIDHDEKRMHLYQELRHEEGWLAATAEWISLSVDRSGPRVAPYPADQLASIRMVAAAHAALPRPERLGRSIGIRRKP